jgi:HPt (histidine-containing phosphotransfer) domain-containing protein
VHTNDATLVLDREQLRDITLEDEELMREILSALIEDTSQQLVLLDSAIQAQDPERCKRLAHYCKGACANVGANAAAAVLRRMEHEALAQDFGRCAESLAALTEELERLKDEAKHLS